MSSYILVEESVLARMYIENTRIVFLYLKILRPFDQAQIHHDRGRQYELSSEAEEHTDFVQ